jgi:hemoglobin-like flavoprotein
VELSNSVHQILSEDYVVVDLFYEIYLAKYPDIRRYFDGVDLGQQAVLLTNALTLIEKHHTHRYPATGLYLRVLGSRHARMGVAAELYPDWRDCLLDTLERYHGEQWTAGLENEWSSAIHSVIDAMLEGYRQVETY